MQRALVLFLLLATACAPSFEYPETLRITCASDSECPTGWACSEGRCFSAKADRTAPRFVREPTLTPGFLGERSGHESVLLEFELDEDVGTTPPGLVLALDGVAAPACAHAAGSTTKYSCPLARKDFSSLGEGAHVLSVTVADASDNRAARQLTLTFDFTAPGFSREALVRPGKPATTGELVLVRLFFNEPLAGAPELFAVPASGASLAFDLIENAEGVVSFTRTVAASEDGNYALQLSGVVDRAGNPAGDLALPSFEVDTRAPDFRSFTTDRTRYSAQPDFNVVSVDLRFDEAPAKLSARLGTRSLTCQDADSTRPVCTLAIDADFPGAREGMSTDWRLEVEAEDAAGNVAQRSATLVLDFAGPKVLPGTVRTALVPGVENPLPSVTRVTTGTAVDLSFGFDEETLRVESVASDLPAALAFASTGAVGGLVTFRHVLGGKAAQGLYRVQVTAVDSVGNAATSTLPDVFEVDTELPKAPVTADGALRYHRAPYGHAGRPGVADFWVEAAGVGADAVGLLAFDRADRAQAMEIGRVLGSGVGPHRLSLIRADRPEVFVSSVDAAGNLSDPPVRVQDCEFWAAPGATSPHQVLELPRFSRSESGTVGPGANVEAPGDGRLLTTLGAGRWQRLVVDGASATEVPTARKGHAMAYDRRRGVTVLFGGEDGAGVALGDTWEWDGLRWQRITGAGGPSARRAHAMAWDAANEVVVLFGGCDSQGLCGDTVDAGYRRDTWTYDGARWTEQRPQQSPAVRKGHALACDEARGRVVLAGGRVPSTPIGGSIDDYETWEWDGVDWTPKGAKGAVNRPDHALVFDRRIGQVLRFGEGVLSRWNGTSWTAVTATGTPSLQAGIGLVYEESPADAVLLTGMPPSGAPMVNRLDWNGAQAKWSVLVSSSGSITLSRRQHALAFDAQRAATVVFGGVDGGNNLITTTQERIAGSNFALAPRVTPAAGPMAYDAARDQLWMVSSATGAVSTWNGFAWSSVTEGTTRPATAKAMAYDAGRSVLVLLDASGATWERSATGWTNPAPATAALAGAVSLDWDGSRTRAVTAYNPGSGRQVEVLAWNGANWVSLAPGNASLAYTVMRGAFDLRLGATLVDTNAGTWLFTPATGWGSPVVTASDIYDFDSLAWDGARGRVVRYRAHKVGGSGGTNLSEFFEFTGSGWTQRTPGSLLAHPPPGHRLQVGFDGGRGSVLGVGDLSGDGTWVWRFGAERSGHLFRVEVEGQIPDGAQVGTLGVDWTGGATGFPAGVETKGASVELWRNGRWETLGTIGASAQSPALASVSTAGAYSLARAQKLLEVALVPTAANGYGGAAGAGSVVTDFVQVRLRYRLP